jgi:signal transduction histidine kinase
VPIGALAPLAGPPLWYPAGHDQSLPDVNALSARAESPQALGLPLDPRETTGFAWAVPLWSERGQIGLLLLGEKRDGGYYSQEEMEIARASGERLVDAGASTEIARRLIVLQRQRLAESQVLDRQTRRVLHDDVLPLLHTALLSLNSGGGAATPEASLALTQAHRQISNLLRDIPPASSPEVARLGLLGALQQMVNSEFAGAFDRVDWQVDEQSGAALQGLRPLPAQVLFYAAREAVRNAARYGRQQGGAPFVLKMGLRWQDGLLLQVQDNGGNYQSGGAQPAGSGQGLALHSTMMAVVGGTLTVESQPGVMTSVSLHLPPGAC